MPDDPPSIKFPIPNWRRMRSDIAMWILEGTLLVAIWARVVGDAKQGGSYLQIEVIVERLLSRWSLLFIESLYQSNFIHPVFFMDESLILLFLKNELSSP
ncbi:hypothetical protein QQ045_033398 [Rhodiola kirilowii]